ncbi:MAG: hypothetical protein D3914_17935, partial [Candidatus Electrothrix sp. LOE2]|nr:hypothetical protein [Candidatus Electrothrix sp. LOE2]
SEIFKKNNTKHEVPLVVPDIPVRIELHRDIFEAGMKKFIDSEAAIREQSEVVSCQDAEMAVPDATFRVLHNFIHHRFDDKGFSSNLLDLRRLYEFVLLCRKWDQEIRYEELNRFCADKRIFAAWQAYQLSAHRLFGLPLHVPVISSYARYKDMQVQLRTHFPRLLWWEHWFRRGCRLPVRLVTPSWYPLKYRQLTSTGEFAKDADQ